MPEVKCNLMTCKYNETIKDTKIQIGKCCKNEVVFMYNIQLGEIECLDFTERLPVYNKEETGRIKKNKKQIKPNRQ